jgi:hypothetical protein
MPAGRSGLARTTRSAGARGGPVGASLQCVGLAVAPSSKRPIRAGAPPLAVPASRTRAWKRTLRLSASPKRCTVDAMRERNREKASHFRLTLDESMVD